MCAHERVCVLRFDFSVLFIMEREIIVYFMDQCNTDYSTLKKELVMCVCLSTFE